MTRRPLKPISEKGVYSPPMKYSWWQQLNFAIDDAAYYSILTVVVSVVSLKNKLFKTTNNKI